MGFKNFKYDIAISFANQLPDCEIAESVNEALKEKGISTYYYKEKAVVGSNVFKESLAIYRRDSMFVLLIASKSYATNRWSEHEFSIIKQREDQTTIIPVRLDDTVLDGLSSDITYLAWDRMSESCAEYVASQALKAVNLHRRKRGVIQRAILTIFVILGLLWVISWGVNRGLLVSPEKVKSLTVILISSDDGKELRNLSEISLYLKFPKANERLRGNEKNHSFHWDLSTNGFSDSIQFEFDSPGFDLLGPATYYTYADSITLKVKKKPELSTEITLRGIVKDSITFRPIQGAWVQSEYGEKIQTDENGSFHFDFDSSLRYRNIIFTFYPLDSHEKSVSISYKIPKQNCEILL